MPVGVEKQSQSWISSHHLHPTPSHHRASQAEARFSKHLSLSVSVAPPFSVAHTHTMLQVVYATASRTCPLGRGPIVHPVRGPHCKHFQALERDVWMKAAHHTMSNVKCAVDEAVAFCTVYKKTQGPCIRKAAAKACRELVYELVGFRQQLAELAVALTCTCPVCDAPMPYGTLIDAVDFEMALRKPPNPVSPDFVLVPPEWFDAMENTFSFVSFYHSDLPDWTKAAYMYRGCKDAHPHQPVATGDFANVRFMLVRLYALSVTATPPVIEYRPIVKLIDLLASLYSKLLMCPVPECPNKPKDRRIEHHYDTPMTELTIVAPSQVLSERFSDYRSRFHSHKRHYFDPCPLSSSSSSDDFQPNQTIVEIGPCFFLSKMLQTYDDHLQRWLHSTKRDLPPCIDLEEHPHGDGQGISFASSSTTTTSSSSSSNKLMQTFPIKRELAFVEGDSTGPCSKRQA